MVFVDQSGGGGGSLGLGESGVVCCRWVVEEFHKAQKTGCNIEDPQFTFVERLQPMIALLSVVATTLLSLRDLSRDARFA